MVGESRQADKVINEVAKSKIFRTQAYPRLTHLQSFFYKGKEYLDF